MDIRNFGQLLKRLHEQEEELHSEKRGSYAPGADVLSNFKDQAETMKAPSALHVALNLMEKHRLALLEVALGNVEESENVIWERVRDIRLYMALFYGLWSDANQDKIPDYIDFGEYLESIAPEEKPFAGWKEASGCSLMLGCLVNIPPDAVVRIKGTLYSFNDDESYGTLDEAIPDQLIFGDDITKDQKIKLIMDSTFEMIKSGEIPSGCKDCPDIAKCFLNQTTDPDPEPVSGTPLQEAWKAGMREKIENRTRIEGAWKSAMEVAIEDEEENLAVDEYLADQLEGVRDEVAVKDWVRVGWEAARKDGTLDEYLEAIEAMGENLPVMDQGPGPVAEGLDAVIAAMIEDGSLEVVAPEVVPDEEFKVELGPASLLDPRTIDFIKQGEPLSFEGWDRLRQDMLSTGVHTAKNPIVAECGRFPESCGDCSLDMCNAHPSNSGEAKQEYTGAEDAAILANIREACEELGIEGFGIFDEDPRIGELRKRADDIGALTGWLGDQTDQLRADTVALQEEKFGDAEEPVRTMYAPDEDEANMVKGTVRHTDRDVPERWEHPATVGDTADSTSEETDQEVEGPPDEYFEDFASTWGGAPDQC